jgi:hypothetical protein
VVATAADVRPGIRRVEHAMGIPIVVDVRDDDVDPEALERMFAWLRWVDATFSTYKDDSELSRLNRGELGLDDVGPAVRWVLERCEDLRAETRGYFDIRAASPSGLDPSGYVKGWSVDRAADILHARASATSRSMRAATFASAVVQFPSSTGGWESNIRCRATRSPHSSRRTISRSRPPAHTSAESTSSIHTTAVHPAASCL